MKTRLSAADGAGESPGTFIKRHVTGDWGELDELVGALRRDEAIYEACLVREAERARQAEHHRRARLLRLVVGARRIEMQDRPRDAGELLAFDEAPLREVGVDGEDLKMKVVVKFSAREEKKAILLVLRHEESAERCGSLEYQSYN